MSWTLPGTVIGLEENNPDEVEKFFSSVSIAGGLVMSQVREITGLEPYTVQNWVKRGFLSPPEKKKYSRRQLCRILLINMLKSAMPMDSICRLLSYVNGDLEDESDDIIDDSIMYQMLVQLAASNRTAWPPRCLDEELEKVLTGYIEPVPGARDRVAQAMKIMLTAWFSSELMHQAEADMQKLGISSLKTTKKETKL